VTLNATVAASVVRGLREEATAGGSSVADLAGEGGKGSSQERNVGRRPQGGPPERHAGEDPWIKGCFLLDKR